MRKRETYRTKNIGNGERESLRRYIYVISQDSVLILGVIIGHALLFFMVVSLWEDILLPQFYLLAGGAALSLGLLFKMRRYLPVRWYHIIQFSGCVVLTHLLLMCSKGSESSFYPLYFFAIILAATHYGMRGSLGVTFLISLSYSSFFIGEEMEALKEEWLEEITSFWILAAFAGYTSQLVLQRGRQIETMGNLNERIIESLISGLITVNLQGELTSYNKKAEEILNHDMGSMLGKKLSSETSQHFRESAALIEENLSSREEHVSCELAFAATDGSLRRVNVSSGLLKDSQGETIGAIAMLTDITQIRELEDEIRKKERLSSIGELAASVAHEVRNPLSIIRGSAQTLIQDSKIPPEDIGIMNFIIDEVDRLNNMIGDLLNFAKPMKPRFAKANPHELINEAVKVLEGEKHITVVKNYCQSEPLLMMDPDQIYQVLINILLNAKEAIAESGTITISTWLDEASGSEVSIQGRASVQRQSLIKISDTGCGIPDEAISKIFDPFFSLKDNGTGLGLSIAYGIIGNHNGRLTATNEEGNGAAFLISLPEDRNYQGGESND